MKEIYILIKHENLIETDKVEVLKVSTDKDILKKEFNKLSKDLNKEYNLLENTESYVSFTDDYNEVLIELMIEGSEY